METKAKGVMKNIVKNTIALDDYQRVLFQRSVIYRQMVKFGTEKHLINTQEVNKVALSWDDDKRVILEDSIPTLAYGHYVIGKQVRR